MVTCTVADPGAKIRTIEVASILPVVDSELVHGINILPVVMPANVMLKLALVPAAMLPNILTIPQRDVTATAVVLLVACW